MASSHDGRPAGSGDGSFIRLHWRAAYECGDERIDREHRRLFERGNALLAAVAESRPRAELVPLVVKMLEEVAGHFADEETILVRLGWPGAAEHAQAHAKLFTRARALANDYFNGGGNATELFDFVVFDLIAAHLLKEDRAFFEAVARRPGPPGV